MFKLLGIKQITPSQKDVLKNLFTKKIDKYTPSITFLTKYQIKKFEKRCLEENMHSSYEIDVNYKYKNDYNKNPFLIYLTKEKAKENIRALKNEKNILLNFQVYILKKFVEKLNNNYKFAHVFANIKSSEGNDNPDTYFPPENNYWSMPSSKDVKLYKKPTKKTITIGFKKRSKKDFMKKFNIKDKIENYYPKLIYLTETVLKRYLNHIKKIIKVEEKFGQKKLIKNKSIFTLVLASFYHFSGSKGFIFYLTKTQIKELTESRKEGVFKGRKSINFSNNQLVRTYKEVIKINSEVYRYIR